MGESLPALFSAAVEVAEQVGFSFDEPGDRLNEDGAWEYRFEHDDRYGWLMTTGPGDPVDTEYEGWGEIELETFTTAFFVDGNLAALTNPTGGTVGGWVDVPVDHVGELEDHLIEVTADEIEHLGGDAEPWRYDG